MDKITERLKAYIETHPIELDNSDVPVVSVRTHAGKLDRVKVKYGLIENIKPR